jgi:hypothetical protein
MTFSIDQFTYSSERRMLVAEASDLRLSSTPREFDVVGRTRTVRFVLTGQNYDAQGDDTVAWIYSTYDNVRHTVSVHILND